MKVHFEIHPNALCMTVHTNVEVNEIKGLKEYLKTIDGVEEVEHGLDWGDKQFSDRYNFSVTKGKLFGWDDIKSKGINLLKDLTDEQIEVIK